MSSVLFSSPDDMQLKFNCNNFAIFCMPEAFLSVPGNALSANAQTVRHNHDQDVTL